MFWPVRNILSINLISLISMFNANAQHAMHPDSCIVQFKVNSDFYSKRNKCKNIYAEGTDLKDFKDSLIMFKHLQHLTFSHNRGKSLPQSVTRITSLVSLKIIGCTELESLPDGLKELNNLETFELVAPHNKLFTVLPEGLFKLNKLKKLSLIEIPLKKLPGKLSDLSHLEELTLTNINLDSFPSEIQYLDQLKKIDWSNLRFKNLPANILLPVNLKEVSFNKLKLKSLPKNTGNLHKLEALTIAYTPLTILPEELGQLNNLKSINISYIKAKTLPKSLFKSPTIENIALSGLDIKALPDSMDMPKFKNGTNSVFMINHCNKLQRIPFWLGLLNAKVVVSSTSLKDLSNIKIKENAQLNFDFGKNYIEAIRTLPDGKYSVFLSLPVICLEKFDVLAFSNLHNLTTLDIYFSTKNRTPAFEEEKLMLKYEKDLKKLLPNTHIKINQ